jgi:hypothetical protein
MIGVTLVGLFLTPVFYVVLRGLILGRRKTGQVPPAHPPAVQPGE